MAATHICEDSRNVIRNILSAPETYAVVLKDTKEPIGSVGIMFGDSVHSADMQEGDAEIGYWIGVPYWGKGLIPEAVHRLLEHCFEDLGIKKSMVRILRWEFQIAPGNGQMRI